MPWLATEKSPDSRTETPLTRISAVFQPVSAFHEKAKASPWATEAIGVPSSSLTTAEPPRLSRTWAVSG